MRSSKNFIPMILDAFSIEILPFDGAVNQGPEWALAACSVIQRYAGLLQAADLSLSQRQAGAMLQARLIADRKARLPEITEQVNALINTPV